MEKDMDALRFPVGKFLKPEIITAENKSEWISVIEKFPAEIKKATEGLSEEDLKKTYRPGGWNIRQVVHHCADSHMNAIIRFKLALTEDNLTIKPYKENLWAELPDTRLNTVIL